MKIISVRFYQAVQLKGPVGIITYVNLKDEKKAHFKLELVPGLGVKVQHEWAAGNKKDKETLIVPFTNIGAMVVEEEQEKSKSKKPE